MSVTSPMFLVLVVLVPTVIALLYLRDSVHEVGWDKTLRVVLSSVGISMLLHVGILACFAGQRVYALSLIFLVFPIYVGLLLSASLLLRANGKRGSLLDRACRLAIPLIIFNHYAFTELLLGPLQIRITY